MRATRLHPAANHATTMFMIVLALSLLLTLLCARALGAPL
jgi:hypothetical protein